MYLSSETKAAFQVEPGWSLGIILAPRWGDIDAFGHVNHRTYLQWCEDARNAYFKAFGIAKFMLDKPGPVIKDVGFTYEKSLSYDDEVLITSRVTWLRRSSFQMEYAVWSQGLAGRGHALCVWYVNSEQKSVELSSELRSKIIALDHAVDRR